MPLHLPVVELVFSCLLFSQAALGQQCYFPDGTPIPTVEPSEGGPYEWPCNASLRGESACCNPNDLCTDTGYCIGHAGHWYRGGCTSSSFSPAACAKECLKVSSDSYSNLIYCGSGTGGAFWCCDPGDGSFCCDQQGLQFIANSLWGTYWYHPDNPSASATGSSSRTTSSTHGATAATKHGPSSTGTNNAGSPSPTQGSSASTSLPTAIGVGVGVPLGVLAIGVIAFLFWRERQKTKLQQEWPALGHRPDEHKSKELSHLAGGPKGAATGLATSPPQQSADWSNSDRHANSNSHGLHELEIPPPRELDVSSQRL